MRLSLAEGEGEKVASQVSGDLGQAAAALEQCVCLISNKGFIVVR